MSEGREEKEKEEIECYNCEGSGHLAKFCPSNRGVLKFAEDPVVCRFCNGKGHFARVCSSKDASIICFKCGKYYHKAANCRTPLRGRGRGGRGGRGRGSRGRGRGGRGGYEKVDKETAVCYSCEEVGHFSFECPTKVETTQWRGSRGGIRGRGSSHRGRGGFKKVERETAVCYSCEEIGHFSYECPGSDE